MLDPREEVFFQRAEEVVSALEARNIPARLHANAAEAVTAVLQAIPDGSLVGLGGSITLQEIGLIERLRQESGRIYLLDRYREGISAEEQDEMRLRSLSCDVFLTSANAVTLHGELVNADGLGNRTAAILFGPRKVIVVAGFNKIVADVEEAYWRIREIAAPMNAKRLKADTPCRETGICDEEGCGAAERICNAMVVIEGQRDRERLSVHLVAENLGY